MSCRIGKRKESESDSFDEDEDLEGGYQIVTSADMEKELAVVSKLGIQVNICHIYPR